MIPKQLASDLARIQEDPEPTYRPTFYTDPRVPVDSKQFKPGTEYSYLLAWATSTYREGFGWTFEAVVPRINDKPPRPVVRAG